MNSIQLEQAFRVQKQRLNRLQSHQRAFPTWKSTIAFLTKMLTILDADYAKFIEKHEELIMSIKEEDHDDFDYFIDQTQQLYEEVYLQLYSDMKELLDANQPIAIDVNQATTNAQVENRTKQLKLPTLQLPPFSGKYTDWNSFIQQFNASYHTNQSLTPVQKLQHLLTLLQGPARDIIKHLPITDENYERALELLKKRFENRRAIFINCMQELQSIGRSKNETVNGLQNLHTIVQETIQTFKNCGIETADPILAYLATEKLPDDTRKEFEKSAAQTENIPSTKDVSERIQASLKTLEVLESTKEQKCEKSLIQQSKSPQSQSTWRSIQVSSIQQNEEACVLCSDNHSIRACTRFLEMSIQDRISTAERLKLCFNCLSKFHLKSACQSKRNCVECGARHHTLLHITKSLNSNVSTLVSPEEPVATTSKAILNSNVKPIFRQTLLATAIVKVRADNGSWISMRALVDLGGEASAITESAVQTLKLKKKWCSIDVDHLDGVKSKSNSATNFTIRSCFSSFTTDVDALVMKSLVKRLPSQEIHFTDWPHIQGLSLADPTFNKIGPIDLILGADVCAEIFLPNIQKGPVGTPIAQQTELGWILFGKAYNNGNSAISINTFQFSRQQTSSTRYQNSKATHERNRPKLNFQKRNQTNIQGKQKSYFNS